MISVKQNADTFGAFASTLCLIHCVATPFVFIAQSCTKTCCSATPVWWQSVDYLFLGISFLAIKKSTKETSSNWMKPALWLSWGLLLLIILNESTAWMPLHDNAIYFQVISDTNDDFLSGTYTFEKSFQYYVLDNVVLNITRETPPQLATTQPYNFTLMGVREDNWVNLFIATSFELNL